MGVQTLLHTIEVESEIYQRLGAIHESATTHRY
jgi:hypothetical protein